MSVLAPCLFLGHGSPMNAIEDNAWSRSWRRLGAALPRPAAVLCISAHWETPGVVLCSAAHPATIHDFYGFPAGLYALRYPAPGAPALAARLTDLLGDCGARSTADYGLDHGAWCVLRSLYPAADVPVLQLSLARSLDAAGHYRLAQRLLPLRREGVMILGSGNIVHNLRRFAPYDSAGADWALRFDARVRERLLAGAHSELIDYRSMGAEAALAIPSAEHYLPLLYVAALQQPGETLTLFNTNVVSSISMTSVLIGASLPPAESGGPLKPSAA